MNRFHDCLMVIPLWHVEAADAGVGRHRQSILLHVNGALAVIAGDISIDR
jgi:hypothetical protein